MADFAHWGFLLSLDLKSRPAYSSFILKQSISKCKAWGTTGRFNYNNSSKLSIMINYIQVGLALAFILFAVWCFASMVNDWEHRVLGVPLTAKGRGSKCQLHNWKQVVLLGFQDFDRYLAAPDDFKSEPYCLTCGYVPGRDLMLLPKFLKQLQAQEKAREITEERMRIVEQLREDWFARHIASVSLNEDQITCLRQGYELYDRFVGVLPELYEGHLAAKALKENPVVLEVKP